MLPERHPPPKLGACTRHADVKGCPACWPPGRAAQGWGLAVAPISAWRRLLQLGGIAGGLAAAGPLLAAAPDAVAATRDTPAGEASAGSAARLPVAEIEAIIRAEGTVSNGVLNIEIDRDDIPHVYKEGVPVKPAFEIDGNLCFQALGDGSVMFNGDLCFKPEELNPAIDQMIRHGLVFQAMHQHLFSLQPMVWFMHMRGRGSASRLPQIPA